MICFYQNTKVFHLLSSKTYIVLHRLNNDFFLGKDKNGFTKCIKICDCKEL